jgi:hypothetical protein
MCPGNVHHLLSQLNNPLVRAIEPPLCEAGLGLDRVRFVCDDKLHLVAPAGQAPCPACGKAPASAASRFSAMRRRSS